MFQSINYPQSTALVAWVGLIFGLLSLLLNWRNYRRDRHDVLVELQWNAEFKHKTGVRSPVEQIFGHIRVTNKGRRPVHITFVGLQLPGMTATRSWLDESVKLEEADASITIKVGQDSILEPYAIEWKKIRASALDNTGNSYRSKAGGEKPTIMSGMYMENARRIPPHPKAIVAAGTRPPAPVTIWKT